MEKIKPEDLFIVYGPQHFEVVGVKTATKKEVILENGVRFNPKNMLALNSKFSVMVYTEEEANYFESIRDIPRLIVEIDRLYKASKENKELVVKLRKGLIRLKNRLK